MVTDERRPTKTILWQFLPTEHRHPAASASELVSGSCCSKVGACQEEVGIDQICGPSTVRWIHHRNMTRMSVALVDCDIFAQIEITMLTCFPPGRFISSPQQQAVPETLLKKRRTNEKQREERLAKAAEARKVRPLFLLSSTTIIPFAPPCCVMQNLGCKSLPILKLHEVASSLRGTMMLLIS